MVYICVVDVHTIIIFGFYQWKRVLTSSTIMGLKCKLYLKVRHNGFHTSLLRAVEVVVAVAGW